MGIRFIMELLDVIKNRYSVRGYKKDPVEDEKLQKVLEAAQTAPTAANKQPFQLIIIKTKGREDELKRIYHADWFIQAPLVICACSVPDDGWIRQDGKNYSEVDATIAMDHIILTATDLGLGTCWIAAFNAEAAHEVLNIPDNVTPLIFTPLGYPNADPRGTDRKSLKEIIRKDNW